MNNNFDLQVYIAKRAEALLGKKYIKQVKFNEY